MEGGMMYTLPNHLEELTPCLVKLGLKRHNIAAVLAKRAKIDRATWQRWRLGSGPKTLRQHTLPKAVAIQRPWI